ASVFGKAGRARTATDPAPVEMFETVVNLKPPDQWRPGMTIEKLTAEMDQALRLPGVINIWTMPIKARIDQLAKQVETVIRTIPGTSSAYAERLGGGHYLEIDPDRAALARYGLSI